MRLRAGLSCAMLCAGALACGRDMAAPASSTGTATPPDARVRALADAYLAGFFDRNPDAVTLFGVPGGHHDRLPDNSLDALAAWRAKEDAWIADAKRIDA